MRQIASLLLCAAAVFWFVEPPGQAFAQYNAPAPKTSPAAPQKAPIKAPVVQQQEDPIVQQFEQQFAGQFRQLYKTELHFMRLVCQPTKQQYEKISADGETALKAAIRNFALGMRRPYGGEQSDPRTPIAEALAQSVRATLSPEQAARYQKELDQRAAARKRVALLNLVVKVDKVLVLTTEQRGKLSEILENNWHDSWGETQMLMYGAQYFPQMLDDKILPILTETQKNVWRDIPKGTVRFGFNLGFLQGIEMEEEVWDDDRPQENPERADGKAAVKGKGTSKPVQKK